ncbi:MmcQ/YjbR family DNA-binding protein [Pedobacter heparinus]|uniref:MmcQ/YjbR family DNA-binding protein n=1 Tax=Pedobacter heparinus TaxID=984 RepID=UPI00292EB9DF|nr:MmcQ/YjbR family DNA-binding protein [Pedobacter heparinus]
MDIESLRDYCLSLKGTTEGMKWDHLCFMIGEKIFVLASLENGHLCMKCDQEDFDGLTARPGIKQAPHFAKRQWVVLENLNALPSAELQSRITESRKLVLSKLSKKLQAGFI